MELPNARQRKPHSLVPVLHFRLFSGLRSKNQKKGPSPSIIESKAAISGDLKYTHPSHFQWEPLSCGKPGVSQAQRGLQPAPHRAPRKSKTTPESQVRRGGAHVFTRVGLTERVLVLFVNTERKNFALEIAA